MSNLTHIPFEIVKETEKAILFEDYRKSRTNKRTMIEQSYTYWVPKSQLVKSGGCYFTKPFIAAKMGLYGSENHLQNLLSEANKILDLMAAFMNEKEIAELRKIVTKKITEKQDRLKVSHITIQAIKKIMETDR